MNPNTTSERIVTDIRAIHPEMTKQSGYRVGTEGHTHGPPWHEVITHPAGPIEDISADISRLTPALLPQRCPPGFPVRLLRAGPDNVSGGRTTALRSRKADVINPLSETAEHQHDDARKP